MIYLIASSLAMVLASGCVTETNKPKRTYDSVIEKSAPTGFGEAPTPPPPQPAAQAQAVQPVRPPATPPARSGQRPPTTQIVVPITCQGRLDELCGPLLLYYQAYKRLPQSLTELKTFKEFENLGDFTCPVSHQPYTYIPLGVRGPDEELLRDNRQAVKVATYMIVSDPTPAHGGLRYGITVAQQEGSDQIMLRVGILPEK